MYYMNEKALNKSSQPEWFAIKTRQVFKAAEYLKSYCSEVFLPKEVIMDHSKKLRERAVIPHVLFIKTNCENALLLEKQGIEHPESSIPFWIYRYPKDRTIQIIPQTSIDLLRLIATDDAAKCEIFNKKDFKPNERVRVTGGIYEGQEGYVQRVKKNKHVIVKIEGICLVMLPFIHPNLLEPID